MEEPRGPGPGPLVSSWEFVSLTRMLAFLGRLSSADQENDSFSNREDKRPIPGRLSTVTVRGKKGDNVLSPL